MSHWIATDLDGTLFSRSWVDDESVPATWRVDPETGSRAPSSWMRLSTHRSIIALQTVAAVVPVTARDADSYTRVDIPGITLSGPAVISNGAIILDRDGQPDPTWENEMIGRLDPWQTWLEESLGRLVELSSGNARPRLVAGARGQHAYLVAKADAGWWESDSGREVLAAFDWADCRVSVLGNELQVLPPGLGKLQALEDVMGRYFGGRRPMLCFGDMIADLEFMRLGEILATPRQSALEIAWPRS